MEKEILKRSFKAYTIIFGVYITLTIGATAIFYMYDLLQNLFR